MSRKYTKELFEFVNGITPAYSNRNEPYTNTLRTQKRSLFL